MRRWIPDDAEDLHEAITANVERLRPRMPWVAAEPLELGDRRLLLEKWEREWAAGGDVPFAVRRNGTILASAGLHRRLGPGALEIGYWVDSRHQGQGIATATSRALTDLAFTVAGIERVEIHHDVTNVASSRIPEKLGYTRLPDVVGVVRERAPADTGTDAVWRVTIAEWLSRPPRT